MSGGIYTALAGAIAQSDALDTVAQNVAHASTTGYRAERVRFEEVLQQSGDSQVAITRGARDPRAGAITHTGDPLDVALEGQGHIQVQDGQGEVHDIRGGRLTRDVDGVLVDLEGRHVMAEDGNDIVISPEAKELVIGEDGSVVADGEVVAKLAITGGRPRVVGGAIEGSNVNVVRSMVDLVKISRTYEALTRMIEGYKAIDERTARDIGPR